MTKYKFNLKRDKNPEMDAVYKPTFRGTLPKEVDFRPDMPPIFDQEELGSCTANALAADLLYIWHKQTGLPYTFIFSRLFLYYNERLIDGDVNSDGGSTGRTMMRSAEKYGACYEKTWPYDITKFADKPPKAAYLEALNHQMLKKLRIPMDVVALKEALASGDAICTGINVYNGLTQNDDNVVPMPNSGDEYDGGHEILIVGYTTINDDPVWIMRNSWGEDWGDKGYFYLPEQYLLNEHLTYDFWAVVAIENGPDDPHNLKAIPTKIKENGLITSEMVNLAQKQAVAAGYSDVTITGEITGQSDFLSKQVACDPTVWMSEGNPSPVIKAIQKVLGVEQTGVFDRNTLIFMEVREGTTITESIDCPSRTLKRFQHELNKGTFF